MMNKDFEPYHESPKIDQEKPVPQEPVEKKSWKKRVFHWLSRYSLVCLVGTAALLITILHFQGELLIHKLKSTPLPHFFIDGEPAPKAIPDKTQVYEQALQKQEKQQRTQRQAIYPGPNWGGYPITHHAPSTTQYLQDSINKKMQTDEPVDKTNVSKSWKSKSKRVHSQRKKQQERVSDTPDSTRQKSSFFQPVRKKGHQNGTPFIPCVIHGDQQSENNTLITLRLTEPIKLNNQKIPVNTLVYGQVRIAQNQMQIKISRIHQQAVNFLVYDHTYHPGIPLDTKHNAIKDAARETAYQEGYRSTRLFPLDAAARLGRNLLQNTKNKSQSIFLPDGYPLYIVNTNTE